MSCIMKRALLLTLVGLPLVIGVTVDESCMNPPVVSYLDQNWIESAAPDGWYFPLYGDEQQGMKMSNAGVRSNFRFPTAPKVPNLFCPRMTWRNNTGEFRFFGKTWAVFNCESQNGSYAVQHCRVTEPNDTSNKEDKVSIFTTLTDNSRYWFVLRCWEDGDRDWALISASPSRLESDTVNEVFNHVESLGFNNKKYSSVNYSNCVW